MIKQFKVYLVFSMIFLALAAPVTTNAQFGDFLEKAGDLLKKGNNSGTSLSEDKIAEGLKEALKVGSGNAVNSVSAVDGFLKNELIKIALPKEVKQIESTARKFGLDKQFDELVLSMNRAAESASAEALPILIGAVKEMTFQDAIKIFNGRENEATLYFKDKTYSKLQDKFQPIVESTMKQFKVTEYYDKIVGGIKKIPFVKIKTTNLNEYVTSKALDGLYLTVEQEEAKIRKDPAARVTDILKDVFGGN